MTRHKMTVEVDFEVDESDIANYASDELADRVEKSAWYHEIRKGVDAMVLDEVRGEVQQRVKLALDRGVTDPDTNRLTSMTNNLNAKTGAGEDWYPTITIEAYIERAIRFEVQDQVSRIAARIAKTVQA